MSDYRVDMAELASYAEQLTEIGDEIAACLSLQTLEAIATGLKGGLAQEAVEANVVPAWEQAVAATSAHLASHGSTLAEIARSYEAAEDDAQTSIRGFFEGRLS